MNYKTHKRILPINLYLLLTILSVVIWIYFPELDGLLGASSPIYVFLFAVGAEKFWIGILAFTWIAILIISIIIFYILARNYNKYTPFIITAGLDLLISALVIGSIIYNGYSTDIGLMLTWYIVCILYYIWMIYWVYKFKKENNY